MKAVFVESGRCILHALTGKISASTPDFEPIMAIASALVVGVKVAYYGTLPPLCEDCDRYLRILFAVNGVSLV
jgi:hypothetical protein